MNTEKNQRYYVPHHSYWPIVACIGLFFTAIGLVQTLHSHKVGLLILGLGLSIILFMFVGWFRDVIKESLSGKYSNQMNRTFRWGMIWFIFSEIFFFGAFFGALFYARKFSVPLLGGLANYKISTHQLLHPSFEAAWPLLKSPDTSIFPEALGYVKGWGLPTINTLLLLSSGVTITLAHKSVIEKNKAGSTLWLIATILFGWTFLFLQYIEYHHAIYEMNLTLNSGIYGSTFYMLTGFHGAHVLIGSIMLLVMSIRSIKGHFLGDNHFAFEATAWYWHFVDVVWLGLYVLVYWL